MKKSLWVKNYFLIIIVFGLFASGCATTTASYNAITPPKDSQQLAKYANLAVELKCSEGVSITSADQEKMLLLIVKNIPEEAPGRFASINPATPGENCMRAVVNVTRYDEGNAFARMMLAGLGQIHIDAKILLTDYDTKESLATYEVNKTFAWGGMYGGVTRIQDLHEGFAKGCAAAIVGKKEDSGGK